jgi:hypothetical protein
METVDLDRSRLSFAPDNTQFFIRLLELGTPLKHLRLHVGGDEQSRYEERHCLDLSRLFLPQEEEQPSSLSKSPQLLESLTLECMNISIAQGNSLLQAIAVQLPNLRYLKIINLPSKVVTTLDEHETFLEIVSKPTNLRCLILTGVGSPFLADHPNTTRDNHNSKSKTDCWREKRRAWLLAMMRIHRQLYSFGPTVSRQIQDDAHLQALADDNRFGGMLSPSLPCSSLWPCLLGCAVESLQDDPERLAGAVWRMLVKHNILFSETHHGLMTIR